ncbi:MAG: crossover junction endodeoxyribonuclease RuvC [Gammaproteobacteria bacterium]|nr:crossover junction endodeoxyribonuclease RuvC [Gammaproteobacteria bacterium]
MATVLGIDPGSRFTGWGIVRASGNELHHIAHGVLKLGNKAMELRLREIHIGVSNLITENEVDRFAIESSFVSDNPQTAIKLGQARGVAIAAAAVQDLTVAEYAPREIKQATVGSGRATKEQVQYMVKVLLNLKEAPDADSADALAVAICDLHASRYQSSIDRGLQPR